jgi:hypothetical protein
MLAANIEKKQKAEAGRNKILKHFLLTVLSVTLPSTKVIVAGSSPIFPEQ